MLCKIELVCHPECALGICPLPGPVSRMGAKSKTSVQAEVKRTYLQRRL